MNNGEDKKILQNLEVFGVKDIRKKIFLVENETSHAMTEFIYSNRQLFSLLSILINKTSSGYLKGDVDVISSVESPVELLTFFHPQTGQLISRLIPFLHLNTEMFAEAVFSVSQSTSLFPRLAFIVIPAVFSFFSTIESITSAHKFYVALLQISDFCNFSRVVFPFFTASCVAPFADYIFRQLFWGNFLKKAKIKKVVSKLLTVSVEALQYLPYAHLNLLQILCKKLKPIEFSDFLLNCLIIPQIKIQSRTSSLVVCENPPINIKELIKELKLAVIPENLLQNVLDCKSVFEIPSFEMQYQTYIFVVSDIEMLLSLPLKYPEIIKNGLKVINCKNRNQPFEMTVYGRKQNNNMILCAPSSPSVSLFFNGLKPLEVEQNSIYSYLWHLIKNNSKRLQIDPVVATETRNCGNLLINKKLEEIDYKDFLSYVKMRIYEEKINDALCFEQFLHAKMVNRRLNDNISILVNYLSLVSANVAFSEAKFHFHRMWSEIETIPLVGNVRYWVAIKGFEYVESSLLGNLKIKTLEPQFAALLNQLRKTTTNDAQKGQSRVMTKSLWEAYGLISTVSCNSPFLSRYFALMSFLIEIEKISIAFNFEESIKRITHTILFAFVVNDCVWILRTAIFLQSVAFNDPRFRKLCDNKILERWNRFTVSIIQILSSDEDLMGQYATLSAMDFNVL